MERERKKQAALADLQRQQDKWTRLLEPVFSGHVNPEINMIHKMNKDHPMYQSLKEDKKNLKAQVENNGILKGAWDT
jgi:hypothetical protein